MSNDLKGETPSAREWPRLLGSAQRSTDLRADLAARLAVWAADRGVSSAALFDAIDGESARCIASVGEGFPDRLAPEEIVDGFACLQLASTRLLVKGTLPPDNDPEIWLLAAAARIHHLEERIKRQNFQARFRGVELEALYEVGLAITSTLDLEELGEEMLLRAVSLLDARLGALYLLEDGCYRLAGHFGGGEADASFSEDDARIPDMLAEASSHTCSPLAGVQHLLAAPIEVGSRRRGLLIVADKESRRGVGPFPESDRRTLLLFAHQAAIALENAKLHRLALEKERLEREMELAAEIQQQLLPKAMPEIDRYQVVGWNRPARQVGGDYFDLRQLGEGRWTMVVGDVTGKGMPAALLVSTLHTALRLLGDRMEIGPEMVARLNQHIYESSSDNKFITMILVELDDKTGVLRYLNAGHNPGVLVRRDGATETLGSSGMPLGLLPGSQFGDASVTLEAGDLVCLYSDGITEAANVAGDELGLERLVELLRNHRDEPLAALVERIDDAASSFGAGLPQGDDQTVVLIRRVS